MPRTAARRCSPTTSRACSPATATTRRASSAPSPSPGGCAARTCPTSRTPTAGSCTAAATATEALALPRAGGRGAARQRAGAVPPRRDRARARAAAPRRAPATPARVAAADAGSPLPQLDAARQRLAEIDARAGRPPTGERGEPAPGPGPTAGQAVSGSAALRRRRGSGRGRPPARSCRGAPPRRRRPRASAMRAARSSSVSATWMPGAAAQPARRCRPGGRWYARPARREPRQEHDRLAVLAGGDHRAHAGMGDDELGLGHRPGVVVARSSLRTQRMCARLDSRRRRSAPGARPRGLRRRPGVHRPDQPVEGEHRADGHEDHSTAPQNSGPPGRARCCHCTSRTSATGRASRPDERQPLGVGDRVDPDGAAAAASLASRERQEPRRRPGGDRRRPAARARTMPAELGAGPRASPSGLLPGDVARSDSSAPPRAPGRRPGSTPT